MNVHKVDHRPCTWCQREEAADRGEWLLVYERPLRPQLYMAAALAILGPPATLFGPWAVMVAFAATLFVGCRESLRESQRALERHARHAAT